MKVITTVRTLNESTTIERFCACYRFLADEILVADGGSTDDTIEKASKLPRVSVRSFDQKVVHKDGKTWSNPRGKHINFLIDWALEREADWIIFDDCDCVPTLALQEEGREILETCTEKMIFVYRMFVMYSDRWFPQMNYPGQSLWAWRAKVPVRADEAKPEVFTMLIPYEYPTRRLMHPRSLLHYFYPDEETIERKIAFYKATGDLGDAVPTHPSQSMGHIEMLPEWAKWRER